MSAGRNHSLGTKERLQPANLEKPVGEQAADSAFFNKMRVYGAFVIGSGKLVKEWRKELRLSRRKLAHTLGRFESQVHYWENDKQRISLLDLQQLSHMVGKDLGQALKRSSQPPENQNKSIEWKGAVYTIDQFEHSIRNPNAILDYSKAQQTYYLKLNPMANAEFHQRDKITTLLEKNGVQAVAELTALKGTRANIMKAVTESMGIKPGDKLNIKVLNVRGPEDPPLANGIRVTPTTTSDRTTIQLTEKLEELGLKARDGDYAKIAIQTGQGEVLITAQIENGAIKLSKDTEEKLLTKARGEVSTFTVRTDSIALSTKPFTEKTRPPPKPHERTTFKLDGKEITIEHQNQQYEITTIEAEKIGNLHLYRYKTKQGEEILHIPTENKTIPPYETPWYALPPSTMIYLTRAYKHQLLEATINKAGGKTQLRHQLKKQETQICIKYLNDQLHDRLDGMRTDKLISFLRYLGKDLDEPNKHIKAIGNARAIQTPNLPFNLNNLNGARIIAARYSDGSIHTPKDAGPRFEYTNKDREQRTRIAEALTRIFGKANIRDIEYTDGRTAKVKATTDIVGHVLQRSGAITGRIITRNPEIPTFIRHGSIEMKREWLKQAFGDEGSPSPRFRIITLERAIDVTHRLSGDQRNRLDSLSEQWKRKTRKVDLRKKAVKYCMFKDLPQDIQDALEPELPRLLECEARILRDDFGIDFKNRPKEIYERKGGYAILWALQIGSKEGNGTFYREIGFPQNRKQQKLKRMAGIGEEGNYRLKTTPASNGAHISKRTAN